ncbi:MAG: tRNA pseudouridine(38-40) synthase TruA [Bacteroidota bacterium]
MKRYFLELGYDGTAYHGWQVQENATSVQAAVNEALSTVLRKTTNVTGCGRTDTGVHASKFFAHFEHEQATLPERIVDRLNGLLPRDIAIYRCFPVRPDVHARFSARSRMYHYRVVNRKDPFEHQRAYVFRLPLDGERMNRAAAQLLHNTDFTSFSKAGSQVKTHECQVTHAAWQRQENGWLFAIRADRFLWNMVRSIVVTLIMVGKGEMSEADFKALMDARKHGANGHSVPAAGLYLADVEYAPEDLMDNG